MHNRGAPRSANFSSKAQGGALGHLTHNAQCSTFRACGRRGVWPGRMFAPGGLFSLARVHTLEFVRALMGTTCWLNESFSSSGSGDEGGGVDAARERATRGEGAATQRGGGAIGLPREALRAPCGV